VLDLGFICIVHCRNICFVDIDLVAWITKCARHSENTEWCQEAYFVTFDLLASPSKYMDLDLYATWT